MKISDFCKHVKQECQRKRLISRVAISTCALLMISITGCEKVPTWDELSGNEKEVQPAPLQPTPQPTQQVEIKPEKPAPPNSAAVISKFKSISTSRISDADLKSLTSLTEGTENIDELNLANSQVGDLGLENIKNLKNLKRLNLSGATKISSAGFSSVAEVEGLESLLLEGLQLDPVEIQNLTKLKNVTELSLNRVLMSPICFQSLKDFPKLERLYIQKTQLEDDSMLGIAQIESLWMLLVTSSSVSDRGLSHLSKLPNLTHLDVAFCGIEGGGLKGLDNLTFLSLFECPLKSDVVGPIKSMKNLKRLNLGKLPNFQDVHVKAVLGTQKELTHLALRMNPLLTNASVSIASKFKDLEELDLRGLSNINDKGLASLVRLKNLKVLMLGGTSCTPAGAEKIMKLIPGLKVQGLSLENSDSEPQQ